MVKLPGLVEFYMHSLGEENLIAMAGGGENNARPRLPNIVPPIFAPSNEVTQPQTMTLRDCDRNLWHLKIEKVGDNWYFTDGWRKFLQDNNIEGGDTLLYESACEGLIDFKILGTSRRERGGEGEGVQPLECKNTRGHDVRATGVKPEHVHLDDEIEEKPQPLHEQVVHTRARAKTPRKRRRNSDFYGGDIFSTGQIPVPLNPYFVTRLSQTRVNELYIPLDVIKSYGLQLPERMEIIDPSGRRFEGIRKIWTDGRILFFGGWKAVCRVNLVQKDDQIICEFVGEGRDMHMRVSFFRNRPQAPQ